MNVKNIPLSLYCTKCNVLIPAGRPAVKVTACDWHHVTCPTTNMRRFAAHKQPSTGMKFEREE